MKKFGFFALTLILLFSCNLFENHTHDGKYYVEVDGFGFSFASGDYELNGNTLTINNSLIGTIKLPCKQYQDRIEYTDEKGVTAVLSVLKNGDLKMSDIIVLKKETKKVNKK